MASRKSKTENPVVSAMTTITNPDKTGFSGLLDEGLSAAFSALKEQGVECLSAEESLGKTLCLKMPAIAPRYLLSIEGLPLSRLYMVAGPQESCKSAFLAEVGVWHAAAGGYYHIFETEQKDAAGLCHSFFNYQSKKWGLSRCYTQDDWNNKFFKFTLAIREMMDGDKKKKGVGRIAPIQIGVDSISAVTIEKFSQKMLEEGVPSQNHPLHAKMLSDFLKEAPKLLVDYPITMFLVSHEKYSANPVNPAIQIRNTSGGMAPKYQVTTDISMRRLDKHQKRRIDPDVGEIFSIPLNIQIHKNSMGEHRSIDVEMCWYFDKNDLDPVHGEPRQKTYFDWHTASIELLKDCMVAGRDGKNFSAERAKALRDFLEFEEDDDKLLRSRPCGIEEFVPYRQAGILLEEKIQSDDEFTKKLYSLLNIRRQFLFKPGIDMRDQIRENITKVKTLLAGDEHV